MLLLSGCGSVVGTTVAIRVVNCVSNAGGIDFVVGGTTYVADLGFSDLTTYGYIGTLTNNGATDVEGFQTGGTTITIVGTQTLDLIQPVSTIVASGVYGSSVAPPTFFLFTDNNTLPASGTVRIRAINASPDAGALTFVEGTTPFAAGITYGMASSYAVVSPGALTFSVIQQGSTVPLLTKTLVTTPTNQALMSQHVYTVFFAGTQATGNYTLIVQEDL